MPLARKRDWAKAQEQSQARAQRLMQVLGQVRLETPASVLLAHRLWLERWELFLLAPPPQELVQEHERPYQSTSRQRSV